MLTATGRAALRRIPTRPLQDVSFSKARVTRASLASFAVPVCVRSFSVTSASLSTPKIKVNALKTKAKSVAQAKPKPKKKLTDEEKNRIVLKDLKAKVLKEPTRKPERSWVVFVSEQLKGAGGDAAKKMKETSAVFKALSDVELQRLQRQAAENKEANDAAYKAWVTSHPPDVIFEANRARLSLAHRTKKPYKPIRDERLPKRATGAFAQFAKDRWASGEFEGVKPTEALKTLGQEWQSLPADTKQSYRDVAKAQAEQYSSEVQALTGKST